MGWIMVYEDSESSIERDTVLLLEVTTTLDNSTGKHQTGELNYSKTLNCEIFLQKASNRKAFVAWLRRLADLAESGQRPFLPPNKPLQRRPKSTVIIEAGGAK